MPITICTPELRAPRLTTAAVAVTVAIVTLAGCGTSADEARGSGSSDTSQRPAVSKAAPTDSSESRSGQAAELISWALDVTFGQEYLVATRRTKTEGTTVLRSAVVGDRAECEARSRKGKASLDFVVTASALYSRGSEEALRMSPEAEEDPVRVEVMADRWVKRNASAYEVMREMCESNAQRTWLEKRMPSLDQLAGQTPTQRPGMVQGQPATTFTYRREGGTLEFHIAAEGTPFLLRVTHSEKDLDESFSGFGKPFRVATPQGAVSELQMTLEVLAAQ
ncbi:hypothetical protein ABZZ79_34145 [Streptomyces sp. NPDC006458]|uniref:hypothetical protein n=1 Tax=Streptomyces sp. NPDC006458 TaxID=3154302 RepID=UPI0033AD037B